MCAGLLRYRLCDRDFDCEHCPLDAALRGEHAASWHGVALLNRRAGHGALPDDRLYSTGHGWVQPLAQRTDVWRVGIDAFAATLLGWATEITWTAAPKHHERGEPICDINLGLGVLTMSAPVGGCLLRVNKALERQPALLITDPYEAGWLAEFDVVDEAAFTELLTGTRARQHLALDLRRFRRHVAFRLFADVASKDIAPPSAASISDLRNLIGGDQYVDCIRDFIH
jgi:glycine cleavage system H protein